MNINYIRIMKTRVTYKICSYNVLQFIEKIKKVIRLQEWAIN